MSLPIPSVLSRALVALFLSAPLAPAQAAVATSDTLQVGVQIAGFPHRIDVYRPAGATRAIVFLHGKGGRSWQMAYDLGVNRRFMAATARNVDWSALKRLGVIAIFPQGQAAPGSTVTAWNNYMSDSGQDDVAFLAGLSTQARLAWGATDVALAGHSSGGTMTARMWCEGTTAFQSYFSIAGPMVSPTYPIHSATCTPLAPRPYAAVIGDHDGTLALYAPGGVEPTPEQVAAGLTDTILVSEWMRHGDRGEIVCGATTALDGAAIAPTGPTWSACGGAQRFSVVKGADHAMASIQQHAGQRLIDWVAGFAAANPP